MKRYILILIAFIFSYLLITFVARLSSGKLYEVVRPKLDKAVQAIYATGTVEATVMLPIAPRTIARLEKLYVDEGDEVKKDQLLASFEDDELLQTVQELKARKDLANSNFERAKKLIQNNAISKGEFDTAQSNLSASIALLYSAQAQLDYLTLKSPHDGKIIKRDGEVGQLIPANQAVFWISCCAPLRITSEVDEEDISLVKPGQKVLIRADAFPGKIFNGSVQSITPKGDPIARSYRVRISFTEPNPLLIGMTAETNIIVREKEEALLLPSSAVQNNKLWIFKDGKINHKTVEIGAVGLGFTEIIKGIESKDLIVINSTPEFEDGLKIRAKVIEQES